MGSEWVGRFVWDGMSEWDGRSEICAKVPPLYPPRWWCWAARRRRNYVCRTPRPPLCARRGSSAALREELSTGVLVPLHKMPRGAPHLDGGSINARCLRHQSVSTLFDCDSSLNTRPIKRARSLRSKWALIPASCLRKFLFPLK